MGVDVRAMLNHLAGTAVYVIRQDDHALLYFNDRVREVTPGVRLGDACHEVWRGTCDNCPLAGIEGKEYNTTVNYDDPFGAVVDLSATRMEWEGGVPAFLVCVTPHAALTGERQIEARIQKGREERAFWERLTGFLIRKDYLSLATIDAATGAYRFILRRGLGVLPGVPREGNLSDIGPDDLPELHPSDVDYVFTGFTAEKIAAALDRGDAEYALRFRLRGPDGGYRWTALSFSRMPGDARTLVATLRDISEIQEAKLRGELADRSLELAMQRVYDGIIYFNLTQRRVEMLRQSGAYDLKALIDESLVGRCSLVHEADRAVCWETLNCAQVLRRFLSGERTITVEARCMGRDGRWHWLSTTLLRMEDNAAGDVMGMCLVQTIDERKAVEQKGAEFLAGASALFEELILLNLRTGLFTLRKRSDTWDALPVSGAYAALNEQYERTQIHPDDRAMFRAQFSLPALRAAVAAGRRRISAELRHLAADGSWRWTELCVVAMPEDADGDAQVLCTYRDIHALRLSREEQRLANERFALAVRRLYSVVLEGDLLEDAVYVWTFSDGRVCRTRGGRPLSEHIRADAMTALHPDYREEFLRRFDVESLRATFASGQSEVYFEAPRREHGGEYRWFSMQAQACGSDQRQVMFYFKDLDDTRREEERKRRELLDALRLAEQASGAKTDFLSRMSHDIRTPMNAILGMAAIAQTHAEDPARVRDCLKKIDLSAGYLLSLINDILDMSKIESGKLSLSQEPFDLRELLGGVGEIIGGQAEKKRQHFRVEAPVDVAPMYVGDPLRLRQILMNLLSNAVKYTPEGGHVALRAEVQEEAGGDALLTVRVEDDGMGMTEAFIARMYEPFEQEQAGGGRVFEGTGLGLSITHSLVSLLGGTIDVQSAPGRGTRFTVCLPLYRAPAVPAPPAAPDSPTVPDSPAASETAAAPETATAFMDGEEARFHGERVLLVEDNELNMEIACTLLRDRGLVVDEAVNGRVALERFARSEPYAYRAVLMDIRMPVMDGLEATRGIRALPRPDAAAVPILAMTANAFSEEKARAREAGMTGYLTKPIDMRRLFETLLRAWAKDDEEET